MRIPQTPPQLNDLLTEVASPSRMIELFSLVKGAKTQRHYLHWDKLRRYSPPSGVSHREWWMVQKISRMDALKPIALKDRLQQPFLFAVTEFVLEELHQIDLGSGGLVSIPEPITNPQTRDRYLVSSLMKEAITSSQLEGAVTTREVAKEMIRSGRMPRDNSEQMILNNYVTMQRIRALKTSALSPELVFQIHQLVTVNTLDDPTAAGRFRRPQEKVEVCDDYGTVYHTPPPAEELAERMAAMCAFANGETPGYFVHPAVRAIILHFWLAYDHPFVDGNGRTARALFYWAMLHNNYWLFEFISISSILRNAPSKYVRSFLYTETDDNDLTYFIIAQTQVIGQAIRELHTYIERKTAELRDVESHMRAFDLFNHRQVEIIRHALKNPGQRYTFASHQKSHNVVYQTARTDLLKLAACGVLEKRKKGKKMVFVAPADLSDRLLKLEREAAMGLDQSHTY
jgi:Fic family protein